MKYLELASNQPKTWLDLSEERITELRQVIAILEGFCETRMIFFHDADIIEECGNTVLGYFDEIADEQPKKDDSDA